MKERLGYACINTELRAKGIYVNRGVRKATRFSSKGLDIISDRALQNIKDLLEIVQWNHDNGISFYRMSSGMFPWWTTYEFQDLKDWPEIQSLLLEIGEMARTYIQRLTFHPSHFVVLGSLNSSTQEKSRIELERHSQLLDEMGFQPSHWNKLNIHIGSAQGGKDVMMERWVESFNLLSENCRKRVVVENDDKGNMYSVADLHEGIYSKVKVPITFDIHHHRVGNQGGLSEQAAAQLAESTWKPGEFVIHHSSMKKMFEDNSAKEVAHADYIYEEIQNFGTDAWIMCESKAKEKSILDYITNGPRSKAILS